MSKHTPGPWTWHPTGLVRETMASVSVLGCHNHTPYVSHADARLICAAPEMLICLRRLQQQIGKLPAGAIPIDLISAYEYAGVIIAKAEGG